MSRQSLILGLDPAGLAEWAPFVLVVDDDLCIRWASPSVARRVPDAPGRNAAELIRLPEAGSGLSSDELRDGAGRPCDMALLAGDKQIPLTGIWLEADTGLVLLARPRVSDPEELTLFDLDELSYTASIVEVLVAAEEVSASLVESTAAAEVLKSKRQEIEQAKLRLQSVNAELEAVNEELEAEGEALRQAETRFRALFEHMSSGVAVYEVKEDGNDFVFKDFNAAGEKIERMKRQHVIGRSVLEVFPGVTEMGLVEVFRRVWRTGKAEHLPDTLYSDDRIEGWRSNYVYRLPGGEVVSVYDDVTNHVEGERALRESEERYRTIFEQVAEGIVAADVETGRIKFANPAARRMFDYSEEELIRLTIADLLPRDVADPETAGFEALDPDGAALVPEVPCQRKNGTVFQADVNTTRASVDGIDCTVSLFVDVTERQAMEAQLRQSQKLEAIGQLAAGIAHEINTPTQYIGDNIRFLEEAFGDLATFLSKCGGLIDAAQQGTVAQEFAEEVGAAREEADVDYLVEEIPRAIQQSLEGVGRVSKIVRAMKDFSHPGNERTNLDINEAIESTITVARNEWKYVAEMVTELDPELPTVPCLPDDFNQMILNIIVNAAHAIGEVLGDSPEGKGKITVSTRQEGEWAEIRIGDTGKGMSEEVRSRIFDPFFTTKGVGKGTGQGLSIAHSVVVKKHGGTIACESEPDRGATFIIRLPMGEPPRGNREDGA